MIVTKTKMKKIPKTCKTCPFKRYAFGCCYCLFTGLNCPTEKKESGNVGYGMPDWCPLMEIKLIEESEDETD